MNGKILLVEDSPDDQELVRMALEEYAVTDDLVVVNDGEQALEYLFGSDQAGQSLPEKPAVILLDLKLPKVNGLEVLTQLRANERTALIPVVVLTSSNEERDVASSYNLGANSYIRKPVDFDQFAKAIQCLGGYWLRWNHRPPEQ